MIKRWYLKNIAQERTPTGEKFTLTTNTPCHLWMRWTRIPPQTHPISTQRRGLNIRADLYFCFDAYEDNEQTEPNDTTTHTFFKEPWPCWENRWYYYHGTIDTIPSPSTTPVFHKYPIPPYCLPTLFEHYDTNTHSDPFIYGQHQKCERFSPTIQHTITKLRTRLAVNQNTGWDTYTVYLDIQTEGADGKPSGQVLTQGSIPSSTLKPWGLIIHQGLNDTYIVDFTVPEITLYPLTNYFYVLRAPGAHGPLFGTETVVCGGDEDLFYHAGWTFDAGTTWNYPDEYNNIRSHWYQVYGYAPPD